MKTLSRIFVHRSALALAGAAAVLLFASPSDAALHAYDGFGYATGNLSGNNGSTGFNGAWTTTTGSASNITVVSPGMTHSSLTTAGNKVSLVPTSVNAGSSRSLSATRATPGSGAVYVSFLINHTAGGRYLGLQLLDPSGTEIAFIGKNSGVTNWRVSQSSGTAVDSGVAISGNNPALLVVKIQAVTGTGNDIVSLWVNPPIGGAEPAPNGTLSNMNLDTDGFNRIAFAAGFTSGGNSTSTGHVDEVRIGSDWASVTPGTATPLTKILFMGNSFTHGFVSSVKNYNSANIHDFNGTNHGGVPGIFLKMATNSGVTNLQVSVELVDGYTLSDHRANKIAAITTPGQWGPYSWLILQDYSGRATPFTAINGNVTQFRTDINDMNTLAKVASPGVKTLLYTTWGVPSYVPTYFTSIQTMQTTVTTNYRAAAVDFSLGGGQTPVGQAFMLAVNQGLSINPNITTTPGAGQLNLWDADNKHASKYGSYLAALMFYQKILNLDPRTLPTGTGSVRENLGISLDHATRLADVAYAARTF